MRNNYGRPLIEKSGLDVRQFSEDGNLQLYELICGKLIAPLVEQAGSSGLSAQEIIFALERIPKIHIQTTLQLVADNRNSESFSKITLGSEFKFFWVTLEEPTHDMNF